MLSFYAENAIDNREQTRTKSEQSEYQGLTRSRGRQQSFVPLKWPSKRHRQSQAVVSPALSAPTHSLSFLLVTFDQHCAMSVPNFASVSSTAQLLPSSLFLFFPCPLELRPCMRCGKSQSVCWLLLLRKGAREKGG